MAQDYVWPSSSAVTVDIASEGINGDPAPGSTLQVGGEDPSGDLQPLQVNGSGELLVSIGSGITNPLPVTDAAVEASLSAINTKTPALGQAAMAASSPVVIASNQSAIPVSAAALPLPSGAATFNEQLIQSSYLGTIDADTGNIATSTASIDTKTPALVSGRVPVDGSGVTQPVSGTVTANLGTIAGVATETTLSSLNAKVTAVNTGAVVVASSALPTGAATETTLSAASAKLPATLGQKAMTASMAVAIASDQSSIPVAATPVVPPALTVKSAGITVGTSAVRLTTDGSAPSSTRRVLVANCDSANTSKFYIGPSGVTAATGILLVAGQTFAADNDAGDYYVISNTAGQTLFVMEQE